MRIWILLAVLAAGCSSGDQAAAQGRTKEQQAALEAGVRLENGEQRELVVSDAVLKRIVAGDKTLTDADVTSIYAPFKKTQYVQDFERIAAARGWQMHVVSKDRTYFGIISKDEAGHHEAVMFFDGKPHGEPYKRECFPSGHFGTDDESDLETLRSKVSSHDHDERQEWGGLCGE